MRSLLAPSLLLDAVKYSNFANIFQPKKSVLEQIMRGPKTTEYL